MRSSLVFEIFKQVVSLLKILIPGVSRSGKIQIIVLHGEEKSKKTDFNYSDIMNFRLLLFKSY